MRFVLVNQALFNRGDESAHKALVYNLLLHYPDCSIEVLFVGRDPKALEDFYIEDRRVCYTNLPASASFRHQYIKVLRSGLFFIWYLMRTPRRIAAKLHKADWVISSPGDASLGARYDWDHLFFIRLAQLSGCKVAYLGRAIGPFTDDSPLHRRFAFLAKRALKRMNFISLRDAESWRIADSLKLRYSKTYDLSFLGTPLAQIPESIASRMGDKYAVIVPNYMIQYPEFRNRVSPTTVKLFYAELIRQTVEKFPDVTMALLPQLFNGNDYIGRDMEFFLDIAELVNDPRVIVISDDCSSDVHQAIYRDAQFVIGARHHSIVYAINNDVPFVALCFEPRVRMTLDELGKSDRIVDIEHAFDLRSEDRVSQQAVGSSSGKLLNFDARVAISRTLEKLDSLHKDAKAQHNAKSLTAESFKSATELMGSARGNF